MKTGCRGGEDAVDGFRRNSHSRHISNLPAVPFEHDAITWSSSMSIRNTGNDGESLLFNEAGQPSKALLNSQSCSLWRNLIVAQSQVDVPLRNIAIHGQTSDGNALCRVGGCLGGGGTWKLRRCSLVAAVGCHTYAGCESNTNRRSPKATTSGAKTGKARTSFLGLALKRSRCRCE